MKLFSFYHNYIKLGKLKDTYMSSGGEFEENDNILYYYDEGNPYEILWDSQM